MKKQTIIILSVVAALALILGAILLFGKDTLSVVGAWETEATVINPFTEGEDAPGKLQFYFYEDLTGKEITIANGHTNERKFTYELADGELTVVYESEEVRKFPYVLEKDMLLLEMNGAAITFNKISDN